MEKILWTLLNVLNNNWGYSTQLQKRFEVNDVCKISNLKTVDCKFEYGEPVKIIETGRHDYLIQNIKTSELDIVYQFELTSNINIKNIKT